MLGKFLLSYSNTLEPPLPFGFLGLVPDIQGVALRRGFSKSLGPALPLPTLPLLNYHTMTNVRASASIVLTHRSVIRSTEPELLAVVCHARLLVSVHSFGMNE